MCTSAQTPIPRAGNHERRADQRIHTMLGLLATLVLIAAVLMLRLRVFQQRRAPDFGWMSERWITEYRASHP